MSEAGFFCSVGHRRRAFECPACAESMGATTTLYMWKWYRTRTGSKRVKAAVDARIASWPSDGPEH